MTTGLGEVTIPLDHRVATVDDAPVLAQTNRQLIADEGLQNQTHVPHPEAGMRSLLGENYADKVWLPGKRISVDALIGHWPALEFWRSVAFVDYLNSLKLDRIP